MKTRSLLTFTLHGMLFGVNTETVKEIIWLPELTPIEENPLFIPGVINMHGNVMPVMDLIVRLGHIPLRYNLSDRVIILSALKSDSIVQEQQKQSANTGSHINLMGIIVNEVLDVIDVPEENIEPSSDFKNKEIKFNHRFISGEAKSGHDIIMIMDPRTFFEFEFGIEDLDINKQGKIPTAISGYFNPEAEQEEIKTFHARAINLQQVLNSKDSEKIIPVAVVSLNNEYICVELEAVREFSKIRNFTPVPCCPSHIAGNMNFRGSILTVVDISGLLNLQSGKITESTKVIVSDSGDFPIGVIVDEIIDVLYIKEADIVPVSSSIQTVNENFIKGTALYGNRMTAILDFKEILSSNGLIVNEEV